MKIPEPKIQMHNFYYTEETKKSVETINALREVIKSKPAFEPGTVIRFDSVSRSRGNEQVFNYAALYADDMRWYLTGVAKHYGDRLTTTEFMEVLKKSDVDNVSVASGWDKV